MNKISVIMSVRNGERYLKESLESILNQTVKNFEFIIVDDGSTDATLSILKGYEERDGRIKIIVNKKGIGLTKSLNKAITEASGEYIARMDSDDISMPERLEKQLDFMENNTHVDLLGTWYYGINEEGRIVTEKILPAEDEEIRESLIRDNPFSHSAVMIRRRILDRVGLYREDIKKAQDYELWFRISRSSKVANLKDFLLKNRYTKEGISIKDECEQLKWVIKIRKDAILKNKQYSKWNLVFLIRPYLVMKIPFRIRRFLRKYFLNSKIYE